MPAKFSRYTVPHISLANAWAWAPTAFTAAYIPPSPTHALSTSSRIPSTTRAPHTLTHSRMHMHPHHKEHEDSTQHDPSCTRVVVAIGIRVLQKRTQKARIVNRDPWQLCSATFLQTSEQNAVDLLESDMPYGFKTTNNGASAVASSTIILTAVDNQASRG